MGRHDYEDVSKESLIAKIKELEETVKSLGHENKLLLSKRDDKELIDSCIKLKREREKYYKFYVQHTSIIKSLRSQLMAAQGEGKVVPTINVPLIYIQDTRTGEIRRVGALEKDSLHISEDGQYIYYENLDSESSTRLFIEDDPDSQMYRFVKFNPNTNKIDNSVRTVSDDELHPRFAEQLGVFFSDELEDASNIELDKPIKAK